MRVEGMREGNGKRAFGVPRRAAPAAAAPAPLARRSLPNDPAALARWLIGKRIVRIASGHLMIGRIVETEAYLSDDPASHSFGGMTARNASMFAEKGRAYVYRIYGIWFCLNVSAGASGHGAAVLIRAIEPEQGSAQMGERRGGADARDLARGPGRLCSALDIDRRLDGLDLCGANGALWLAQGRKPPQQIGVGPRIGVTKATDLELRFYERGNLHVSGPASGRR
jgi:DNA-3-methyladenine glycosylase